MHLFLAAFFGLTLSLPAYAYVDPGSGALIWQLVMAFAFGALFYVKSAVRWLKKTLPGKERKKQNPGPKTEDHDRAA